jgi:hypothetical protein
MKTKDYRTKINQQGVTLMLSILVLSAILAISFSLATVLLIEIRTSGDLVKSEPAVFGAEAVIEEALFKVKRGLPTCPTGAPDCISSTYNAGILSNGVILNNPAPTTSRISDLKFRDIVPRNSTFANTLNSYALFDINCPVPDPSSPDPVCKVGGSRYGKVKLTYLDSGNNSPLRVYICQFDPSANPLDYLPPSQACSDATGNYWLLTAKDFPITPTTAENLRTWQLDPNWQQEILVFNPDPAKDIYVQIEAYGPGATYAPQGIPLRDTQVDITAGNAGVVRRVRVSIPKPGGAP